MANQRFRTNFSDFESQAALGGVESFVDPFSGKVKAGLKLSKGGPYVSATSIGAILSGFGVKVYDFYNDKSSGGRRYKFYITDKEESGPISLNENALDFLRSLPGVKEVYEDEGKRSQSTLLVYVG